MVKKKEFDQKLELPEGVQVTIDEYMVTVKGPKGKLTRKFLNPRIKFEIKENIVKINIADKKHTKRDKMNVNTYLAHLKNMIAGVKEEFEYKLKICSGHFPMSVVVQGKELVVKNFYGEKVPRKARISDDVVVKVEGEFIVVKSMDKELAGSNAARIEQSCRITNRDRRRFMDGIWIVNKGGKALL